LFHIYLKSFYRLALKEQIINYVKKHCQRDKDYRDTVRCDNRPELGILNKIYYHQTEGNRLKVTTTQKNFLCRNEHLKIIVALALMSLSLSLLAALPAASGLSALPIRDSGQLGVGTLPGIQTNGGSSLDRGSPQADGPRSGTQPNSASLSGSSTNPNCRGTGVLFPTANTNCAGSNVIHPTPAPNTAVVHPSNCNIPATARLTSGPSSTVVNPNNCPNTALIQPTNCNIPTTVRHTNTPSTTVVRPTNCPPASSNSLTINNVQSSSTTEQSTNAGIFDYLTAESSQNNIIPVANAGPNQMVYSYSYVTLDGSMSYDPNNNPLNFSWVQLAGDPVVSVSSYNAANPIFIAPIVAYPTTLTFQLVVNNGQAYSSPSYVYVIVEP
jgi:hypothetical protein